MMKPNDNFADKLERTIIEMHGNEIWEYKEWHPQKNFAWRCMMKIKRKNNFFFYLLSGPNALKKIIYRAKRNK